MTDQPGSDTSGERHDSPVCPWCGKELHQVAGYDSFCCENYQNCPYTGRGMPRSLWDGTWAHQRIAALERDLEVEKAKVARLMHFNASKVASDVHAENILLRQRIAELEKGKT